MAAWLGKYPLDERVMLFGHKLNVKNSYRHSLLILSYDHWLKEKTRDFKL